jgi:hypothetical protein
LKDNLDCLVPDDALIDRLLIGNYMDETDIHKRPMSKFMQDIAQQLGII